MNLSEYLNQEDPIRNPSVYLQTGEYQVGVSIKFGLITHTQIFITEKDFVNQFGIIEYISIGGCLYTSDSQGNPKKASVFRLKN
jgi:hypothetical protein